MCFQTMMTFVTFAMIPSDIATTRLGVSKTNMRRAGDGDGDGDAEGTLLLCTSRIHNSLTYPKIGRGPKLGSS